MYNVEFYSIAIEFCQTENKLEMHERVTTSTTCFVNIILSLTRSAQCYFCSTTLLSMSISTNVTDIVLVCYMYTKYVYNKM